MLASLKYNSREDLLITLGVWLCNRSGTIIIGDISRSLIGVASELVAQVLPRSNPLHFSRCCSVRTKQYFGKAASW